MKVLSEIQSCQMLICFVGDTRTCQAIVKKNPTFASGLIATS